MSFSIGLIGLPNVGKSSLFYAITKKQVPRENYPFCTIDPHVGTVAVPDATLLKIADVARSEKIIETSIEFTDIAGLVKGSHKGEGLGNKFLSHIREVDALCHVVRTFDNEKITHIYNRIDPLDDIAIINLELMMVDIATIEKRKAGLEKKLRGKAEKEDLLLDEILTRALSWLQKERLLTEMKISTEEQKLLKDTNLLTIKPMLYVFNVGDDNASAPLSFAFNKPHVMLSARLESDLSEMSKEDEKIFLSEAGLTTSGLYALIHKGYELLSLITYYTAGAPETRAWTIPKETTAKEAAGVIHTDIKEGFIKADIVRPEEFISLDGWQGAKERGSVRTEGKEYIMKDSDIAYFHFS